MKSVIYESLLAGLFLAENDAFPALGLVLRLGGAAYRAGPLGQVLACERDLLLERAELGLGLLKGRLGGAQFGLFAGHGVLGEVVGFLGAGEVVAGGRQPRRHLVQL